MILTTNFPEFNHWFPHTHYINFHYPKHNYNYILDPWGSYTPKIESVWKKSITDLNDIYS